MMTSPTSLFVVLLLYGCWTELLAAPPAVVLVSRKPPGQTVPKCCRGAKILSCDPANINSSILGTSTQIILPNNITASFSNLVASSAKSFHYVGPQVDLVVTCTNDRTACHGHAMTMDGKSFVLESCGKEGHVWKQINMTDMVEKDGPPGPTTVKPRQQLPLLRQTATADNTTMATYSIKFYYTPEFAAVTADIPLWVGQVLADINQGYANSQVPLRAVLCKIEAATIKDVASASTLLANFAAMKSSPALIRDSADVAFLLVNSYDSCGIAYFNVLGMSSPYTFATSQKACSVGYYSPGHEICHNVGCSHDMKFAGPTPYSYAYGHLIAPNGYRTIMAYPNNTYPTRVNYYSNPSVTFPITGTPTGLALANNAAQLILNRMRLAAVGNEAACTAADPAVSAPIASTTATAQAPKPTTAASTRTVIQASG